jgi:hypothetical protein
MRTRTLAIVLAAASLAACAPSNPGQARPNPNILSRAEIEQSGARTVYELIQNERPIWLRERGAVSFTQETDVVVYMDGTRIGGRDSLRDINPANVDHLEFFDARRATYRFGPGHVNGAIMVYMRQ